MLETSLKLLIAILPVVAFLLVLLHLDVHKLIGQVRITQVFLAGALTAILAYYGNGLLIEALTVDFTTYSRLYAPVAEELLKALVIVMLLRMERVGFQVDAAIIGFAVGAGFSFVENLFYLFHVSEAHYVIWMVRGFGTAIMHGGCTALFAVITQMLAGTHRRYRLAWYLPGLVAAAGFHALFNHFPVSPVLSTLATLLIIPTLLFLLFERNKTTIHDFLRLDFDVHRRLLEQLEGGAFSGCETGRFMKDLERIHDSPHVRDMIAYIHVHTELILSAERILMARGEGKKIEVNDQVRHKLQFMHTLERRIGKTGMMTLNPHLKLSRHEFWMIHMFEDAVGEFD